MAVGDWVVPSADGERVEHVLARRSAFVRRASFEGARGEAQALAANIDVVFLVHALTSPPERAPAGARARCWPTTAGRRRSSCSPRPIWLSTSRPPSRVVEQVSLTVPVYAASGKTGTGLDTLLGAGGGPPDDRPPGGQRRREVDPGQRPGRAGCAGHRVPSATPTTGAVTRRRGRAGRAARGWLADRHPGPAGSQPVGQRRGHRAGVPGCVRSRGALSIPGLQARGRARLRGAGCGGGRPARSPPCPEPHPVGGRGGGVGGGAARAAAGRGQAGRPPDAPLTRRTVPVGPSDLRCGHGLHLLRPLPRVPRDAALVHGRVHLPERAPVRGRDRRRAATRTTSRR